MKNLDILLVARLEYASAVDWYLKKSVSAANRFSAEVDSAIEAILKDPEQYARWDDKYRFFLLRKFPYFVAYRQTEDTIVIVAIRHAAQDQNAWKGR
jgi:plasmid stabilization system protein ParE